MVVVLPTPPFALIVAIIMVYAFRCTVGIALQFYTFTVPVKLYTCKTLTVNTLATTARRRRQKANGTDSIEEKDGENNEHLD